MSSGLCKGQGGLCVSSSGPHNLPSLSVPEASLTKVPPSSLVQERSFFVRMKSTLTKRGLHVKASGYKVGVSSQAPVFQPAMSPEGDRGNQAGGFTGCRWLRELGLGMGLGGSHSAQHCGGQREPSPVMVLLPPPARLAPPTMPTTSRSST